MAPFPSQPTSNPRIFIFDATRLRSHLFFRYISTHPALQPIYHPYLTAAMFGPEALKNLLAPSPTRAAEMGLTPEVQQAIFTSPETYASSTERFLDALTRAEKDGRVPVANEHWFNVFRKELVWDLVRGKQTSISKNPTAIPDAVLQTLTPIILIRHPTLVVDSVYRAALAFTGHQPGDEDLDLITSNKELRMLFDFLQSHGQRPIVVDGDDLLWRTEEFSKALCERLGLDAEGLSDRWEVVPQKEIDKMNPALYMFTRDIQHSSGIERPAVRVSLAHHNTRRISYLHDLAASRAFCRQFYAELDRQVQRRHC